MTPTIRDVTAADLPVIMAITRSAEAFSEEEIGWATELVRSFEQGSFGPYRLRLAIVDDGIAGYACFAPARGGELAFDLYWIAIDAAFRRRGLGTLLLEDVEREALRLGGKTMLVETSAANRVARAFYKARGYTQVSQLKDFKRRRADRIVLARSLEPGEGHK